MQGYQRRQRLSGLARRRLSPQLELARIREATWRRACGKAQAGLEVIVIDYPAYDCS